MTRENIAFNVAVLAVMLASAPRVYCAEAEAPEKVSSPEHIVQLIKQLDAEEFAARDKARDELISIGISTLDPLLEAAKNPASATVKDSIESIVSRLTGGLPRSAYRCATLLYDLKKAGDKDIAEELLTDIHAAQKTVAGYGGRGRVIVGRVVVEDKRVDARHTHAQMELLDGGYFAGEVGDMTRPVGFRLHGYEPVDLQLSDKGPAEIVYVGDIFMKPVPKARLATLKGKIVLAGSTDASITKLMISITQGPINTPHNGTSGWRGKAKRPMEGTDTCGPVTPKVDASGEFGAEGFSPAQYYFSIDAPGYVSQWRYLNFVEGQTLDLGSITLEIPKKVELSYIVSDKPPFDATTLVKETVIGGDKWKAAKDDPKEYGWDLVFKQEEGALTFSTNYGPCKISDLGEGKLEDFLQTKVQPNQHPNNLPVQNGHVYLLDQGAWKHWVLFKAEIKK